MAFSRVCFLPNDSLLPCWEPHGKRSPKPSASDVEAATKCLELPVTPDQLRAALHRLGLLEPPSLAAHPQLLAGAPALQLGPDGFE
jgi:hypothetical protein